MTGEPDENRGQSEAGRIPTIGEYMPSEQEPSSRVAPVLTILLLLIPLVGYAISWPARGKLVEYGKGKTVENAISMPFCYVKTARTVEPCILNHGKC